jgi:competence protein ComEC
MKELEKDVWKRIPFLRLLLPLIAGIMVAHYFAIAIVDVFITAGVFILFTFFYSIATASLKFKLAWLNGIAITIIFICTGNSIYQFHDTKNTNDWIGNYYLKDSILAVTIQEPLTEKTKSFKTIATADFIYHNHEWKKTTGNIILYFKKENHPPNLHYGSQLIIHKTLQPITNSGNPGAFNYQQYCAFQDIYAQAFAAEKDFTVLSETKTNFLKAAIFSAQQKILAILKENIKDEHALGIAEALLIGYRDDLDKDLVQAYSNTGVVHIIAISGLHIAMIYGLLIFVLSPFKKIKWFNFFQLLITLFVLWGFSFIAGAAPSILRSTVMFSFIVIGKSLNRQSNIYNNLAASAFTILVFNPYSLWDVGFQLSYAAVLSIVLFQKNISHWFIFQNKLLRSIWQLNAVTIAAQILTLPIILFYFHQFPNFFLFTNLFAVPFSGLILYGELFLLLVAKLEIINEWTGDVLSRCIQLMNHFINNVNSIPLSSWENIQINIPQTIFLYASIISMAIWLIKKNKIAFLFSLTTMVCFTAIKCVDLIEKGQQQKIIVYNVPQHQAIDIIDGRHYQFIGDAELNEDGFLRNFHLKPSRILNRLSASNESVSLAVQHHLICSANKTVFIVDKPVHASKHQEKIKINTLIISNNPRLSIGQLVTAIDFDEIVFDSSNPLWKINKWKKDCDRLHLRHHSIAEQGAFEMDL